MLLLFLLSQAPAGMTLEADSMSADGVTIRHLSCDLNSGGFLALIGVVSSIAGQKPALAACAPAGGAFALDWTWSQGRTAAVTIGNSSLPGKNACVQTAMRATTSGVDGICKGILLIGDAAGAEKAADALLPPTEPAAPAAPAVQPAAPAEPSTPTRRGISI